MARTDGEKRSKKNKRAENGTGKTKAERKNRRYESAQGETGLLSIGRRFLGGFDTVIIVMVLVLSIFGVAMVFSAGYYSTVGSDDGVFYYLWKQGFWVISGLIIMFVVANYDYHNYSRLGNFLMLCSIAMLILVLLVGSSANGATRWIGIGSFRLTPSELSKLFMIIYTAAYLSLYPEKIRTTEGLITLFGVMFIHFALVMKQPNLSTAVVIAAIMLGIMMVAGLDFKWIGALVAAAGAGAFVILNFMKDSHWYSRLTNWIDPFADSQGEGYQVSQSLIALGNGGLKGLGFGKSISKNLYLPEPQNDFILAVIGEELGYVGFILLMIAYIFLLYRLILVALKSKDSLGFYLAAGVAVMLGLQVIINVAVVTASMPATGITLPFISYGGTSMWSFMAAMGIVLNISRYNESGRGA